MCVVILWRKVFVKLPGDGQDKRGKSWQPWAASSQQFVCYYVCLWHPPENWSNALPCLKRGSVPGQTCFRIIDDKLVQGTVPWVALLSLCQAHFNWISSLMYLCILWLSSCGANGALPPHHCVYSSSQLWVSVHQASAFSVTQQNLELCGSCRGQTWVCPLQFMAWGHLYP